MKTITEKSTNISLNVYNDDRTITIGTEYTVANATSSDKYEPIEELRYLGITSATHTLHTGVTEPDDWCSDKYKFDGSSWTKNTDYKIPCKKCNINTGLLTLNVYDATKCSECEETL